MITQGFCTIGRLFVLFGAIWKGRGEYNEMTSLGLKKYFQTTVQCFCLLFRLNDFSFEIGFWSS